MKNKGFIMTVNVTTATETIPSATTTSTTHITTILCVMPNLWGILYDVTRHHYLIFFYLYIVSEMIFK